MAENKKIRNATKAKDDSGIEFKSVLEKSVYNNLKKQGILPEYETHKFVLWEGFIPEIPFYTKNQFTRKNKHIEVLSHSTVKDMRPLIQITYTPDFYFEHNGKKIIVEVKGLENDVFPYKFKMFRKNLENLPDKMNYEIWEIFSIKQLNELITRLNSDNN